jgi:hypothetical protein
MDADAALAIRLILAIGLSWVLTFTVGRRVLRFDWRGAGVVGGICAGIALGPAILGSITPDLYRQLNVGAVTETRALDEFQMMRAGDEAALAESGVSEAAVIETVAENDLKEAALEAEIQSEMDRFISLPLAVASALGLIFLMLGCWMGYAVGLAGFRIGLVAGLLTALLWAVIARKLLGLGLTESIACGGVIAGGTCWSRGRWRWSAGAGSVVIALACFTIAGDTRTAWTVGVAMALGALLTWTSPLSQRARARWAFVAHALVVPGMIAVVVSVCSVELESPQLAFVALAGVFAGDIHMVASWVGINWFESGRRQRYPASSWLGVYEQGWAASLLVLLTMLFAGGLIDPASPAGSAVGLAVAAHAISAELKRPSTHRLMAMMRNADRSATRR